MPSADRTRPDADHEPAAAKAVLRAGVRARRRRRGEPERAAAARGIRDVVLTSGLVPGRPAGGTGHLVVACYASRPGEPGTGPLVSALLGLGVRVLLPHTHDGTDGTPVRLGWGPVEAPGVHARGACPETVHVPGPDLGPAALRDADLVLLPALAVDAVGSRLGQGGGYYDRALGALGAGAGTASRARPLVGLVHDDELLAAGQVPADAHDVRVTHVATPTRWLRTRPDTG